MYAISKAEAFQVWAYNKDGSQMRLFSARTLLGLLSGWTKELQRYEATGHHNFLPTFRKIFVWDQEAGEILMDIPYIETIAA